MFADRDPVVELLAACPREESRLVMLLQDIQAALGYLPRESLERVADHLQIPRARVFGVATFYKVFSLVPQGRTIVQVCKGTACHVRGAQLIEDEICRHLQIPVGSTTDDRQFTVKTVNCVGACAMAPVVLFGEEFHGKLTASKVRRLIERKEKTDAV